MEKITSLSNSLVKETAKLSQKKYRDAECKILLEGYKPIYEAYLCGLDIEYVFVNESKVAEYKFVKEKLIIASEAVLKKISTTESIPEAVGVCKRKSFDLNNVGKFQKVVLLEDIKDAGNLGTILRTSCALGADLVVLFGDCVDLYNPKVVRSAVGALWKIPIIQTTDIEFIKSQFKNHTKIATLPRSKNLLSKFNSEIPFVVMFGSEADGLSEKLIEVCDKDVKIEMKDNVESLNLSISCGIILYKLLIN